MAAPEDIRTFVCEQLTRLGVNDPTEDDITRLTKRLTIAMAEQEFEVDSPSQDFIGSPKAAVYKTYPMSSGHRSSSITPSPLSRHLDVSDSSTLTALPRLSTTPTLCAPSHLHASSSQRKRKACRMYTSNSPVGLSQSSLSDANTSRPSTAPHHFGDYDNFSVGAFKSYIRPLLSTVRKSDPVKRYQQYKAQWQSCPIPGDGSHRELRWKVRENMILSAPNPKPPVPVQSTRTSKTNAYVVPTSKKRQDLRWELRSRMAHRDQLGQ